MNTGCLASAVVHGGVTYGPGCYSKQYGDSVCAQDANNVKCTTPPSDEGLVCPGTTPLPPDMAVGSICTTDGSHTISYERDERFAPSNLTADFLAGKSWSSYDCVTGAESGCTGLKWRGLTGMYLARNVGASLTADLSQPSSSSLLFEAWNSGTLTVHGANSSEALIYNPINVAPSPASLTFSSAKITLLGAQNQGTGPLTVSTTSNVVVTGVVNSAASTVAFTNSQNIFISDTTSAGIVSFTGVQASIYNVSSSGTVNVNGGSYIWIGGDNSGSIVVEGSAAATIKLGTHSGTAHIKSGSLTGVVEICDGGSLTVDAGVTGSITFMSGTCTITNSASGFTVNTYTMDSNSASQVMTLSGVDSTIFDDVVVKKQLECAIQLEIGVAECFNVKITSVSSAARRSGTGITYQVSGQASEIASFSALMVNLGTDTTMLASLRTITGVSSMTVAVSATSTVATCVGNCLIVANSPSEDDDDDDDSTLVIILCVVGGALLVAGASAAAVVVMKSKNESQDPSTVAPVTAYEQNPVRVGVGASASKLDVAPN